MQSATLTRQRPGTIRLARLRTVPQRQMGGPRIRGHVPRGADRLLRLPDVSDLRLLLRAVVGPRRPAPSPARLQGLPRSHRAPASDRLRCALLDLRPGRRAADGARFDRVLRRGRVRDLPSRAPLLQPARRARGGAAGAEPLLRREPRLAGISRHLLHRADRLGRRAGGGTPTARNGRAGAARGRRAAAPRRVGAERPLLAVVLLARRQSDAAALPRDRGDRAAGLVRRGRGRDRQPALLAESDGGPRTGTGTHAGPRERDRLDVDLQRTDRQGPGGHRRAGRHSHRRLARAAPRRGAARGARGTARRLRRRGRRRSLRDRPLLPRGRDDPAAVLRRLDRRLVDVAPRIAAAAPLDARQPPRWSPTAPSPRPRR